RSAALAAARGPPTPSTDNGSPKSGSPGRDLRARRRKAMTAGLWLVSLSQPMGPDDRGGRAGGSGTSSIASIPPDRSSNDSTFTAQGYVPLVDTGNRGSNHLVSGVWRAGGGWITVRRHTPQIVDNMRCHH